MVTPFSLRYTLGTREKGSTVKMTPRQKAQALIEYGEGETLTEAAIYLWDMGEISRYQAEKLAGQKL